MSKRNGSNGNGKQATAVNRNALTPQELMFSELVADPTDTRSIGEKGIACGWTDPKYGWRLARKPHIADKIDMLVAENLRAIRARRGTVIAALGERASGGDNEAAKLFLQTTGDIGTGGHTNINNLYPQAPQRKGDEPFDQWLRESTESRFASAAVGPPSDAEDEE